MTTQELKQLCIELDEARCELMEFQGKNPKDKNKYRLYPGVTLAAIKEAEKKLGHEYPPSYRAFLQLHNGWLGVWPDWSLVGIPRADNRDMYKDINYNLKQVSVVADDDDVAALKKNEKRIKDEILITNHPVIGIDFNGGLLLADDNHAGKDGEPEIVWVRHWLHVQRRWKDFEAYLTDALNDVRKSMKDLQSAPVKRQARKGKATFKLDWDAIMKAVEEDSSENRKKANKAKKR